MKVMILAAGRGQRLRPLTDTLPKPLVQAASKPLLFYHLERLAAAKVDEVIINTAYLSEKIQAAVGDGSRWQLSIRYSPEAEPLETGGALLQALPLLGDAPFLLLNADIWTDYPLQPLVSAPQVNALAHLVLVDNPEHHPKGDFSLDDNGMLAPLATDAGLTFSGISMIQPKMIADYPHRRSQFPLGEVFRHCLQQGLCLTAESYQGRWFDIGTVGRLAQLEAFLAANAH